MKKNRQHDIIVAGLRAQLESKGFKLKSLSRSENMIAEIGHYPDKPKVAHSAFRPDIVMSGNDKPEDRFILDYVHTKPQFRYDLMGMLALSSMLQVRAFILIVNDEIHKLKGVKRVECIPLSLFQKNMKRLSKEDFIKYLEG